MTGASVERKLFTQLLMLKHFYYDENKWNNNFLLQIKALIDEFAKYIN